MATRSWRVQTTDGSHRIELEHSPWTLRRRIVVDGRALSAPAENYERVFDSGSDHQLDIGGHRGWIAIRPVWGGLRYRYALGVDGVDMDTGRPLRAPALAQLRLFPGDGALVRNARVIAGALVLLAAIALGEATRCGLRLVRYPERSVALHLPGAPVREGEWVRVLGATTDCAEARRLGGYVHAVAGRTEGDGVLVVTFSGRCRCGECREPEGLLSRPSDRFARNLRETLELEPATKLYVLTTYVGPASDRLGVLLFSAVGAALSVLAWVMLRRGQLWRQARSG